MGLSYVVCFGTLTMALKKIEVGMAYAIWAGVGIALIATVGAILFRESFTLSKGIALLLIISGVVLLNLVRSSH
jgi:small multidrug resistance pump